MNIKKIVTAACMAVFLATSFIPATSEAAGRMSLAQAHQEVKHPLHHNYKIVSRHHKKQLHHRHDKHRPAMYTRGPISQTWSPMRPIPRHHMKSHGPAHKNKVKSYKLHAPAHHLPPKHYKQPSAR